MGGGQFFFRLIFETFSETTFLICFLIPEILPMFEINIEISLNYILLLFWNFIEKQNFFSDSHISPPHIAMSLKSVCVLYKQCLKIPFRRQQSGRIMLNKMKLFVFNCFAPTKMVISYDIIANPFVKFVISVHLVIIPVVLGTLLLLNMLSSLPLKMS